MAISEAEFKNAFRKVISSEFSDIPKDEDSIEFAFSKRFHKRMEKLIKAQKKSYYKFVNTVGKRVAVICVVLLTLFTAAFSVEAIREPVIEFIKQVYETFTHYSFVGDTTDKITKEYIMTWLPDGFEQSNKTKNDAMIATEFADGSDNTIEFTQMTTKYSTGYYVDNEHGEISTEMIGDIEVTFQTWYDTKSAIWTKDGYVFEITCYDNMDFNTIKQMIKFIE